MPPCVSVLIPVYNCETFLEEALDSIRAQTFSDFECIVVNDGSRDNSLAILERYAASDPRFVVVDKPNGGIVSALNAGLARCTGEFVARMDGDDIALPERFALQVEFLKSHPEVVAVGGWAKIVDETGTEATLCDCGKPTCWCIDVRPPADHKSINDALSECEYTLLHPTLMARTAALREIHGYDSRLPTAEDLDIFMKLGEMGQLANIPEFVLLYRRRANSQTNNFKVGIGGWDVKVLRAAMARGRHVTPDALAKLEERASWQSAARGYYGSAFQHAVKAFTANPTSSIGVLSLAKLGPRVALHLAGRRL